MNDLFSVFAARDARQVISRWGVRAVLCVLRGSNEERLSIEPFGLTEQAIIIDEGNRFGRTTEPRDPEDRALRANNLISITQGYNNVNFSIVKRHNSGRIRRHFFYFHRSTIVLRHVPIGIKIYKGINQEPVESNGPESSLRFDAKFCYLIDFGKITLALKILPRLKSDPSGSVPKISHDLTDSDVAFLQAFKPRSQLNAAITLAQAPQNVVESGPACELSIENAPGAGKTPKERENKTTSGQAKNEEAVGRVAKRPKTTEDSDDAKKEKQGQNIAKRSKTKTSSGQKESIQNETEEEEDTMIVDAANVTKTVVLGNDPSYCLVKQFELLSNEMSKVSISTHSGLPVNVEDKLVVVKESVGQTFQDADCWMTEYEMLRDLNHPRIVKLLHADAREFRFVLKLIKGKDLARYRNKKVSQPKMTRKEAIQFIEDMADVLCYLHGRGFIHNDIKPSNIVMDSDGRAVLTDLGAVTKSCSSLDPAHIGGSSGYIPPDFIDKRTRGMPGDMWAFGIVVGHALGLWGLPEKLPAREIWHLNDVERGNTEARKRMEAWITKVTKIVEAQTSEDPLARIMRGLIARNPGHRSTAQDLRKDVRSLSPHATV